jgi:hypothetical protein
MQLDLFNDFSIQTNEPIEPKYFYTVTWECKDINPETLVHQKTTTLKTAHAVYTSLDQVREMVNFIQQTYSYNGCHIITRHTEKPNLNSLNPNNYIL